MLFKLYQIKKEVNGKPYNKEMAREQFYKNQMIDTSNYRKVLEADFEEMSIVDFAKTLCMEGHPLLCGEPLGIMDVLVTERGSFLLDIAGFKNISFDESKVEPREDFIKALYVEPGKRPFVTEISGELESLQKAVQGLIQYISNGDMSLLVVNEEHKMNGMQGNRRIDGDVIAGPFLVVGDTGMDICSLTDEQIEFYKERFAEPEDISQEEVQEHIKMEFKPWSMNL